MNSAVVWLKHVFTTVRCKDIPRVSQQSGNPDLKKERVEKEIDMADLKENQVGLQLTAFLTEVPFSGTTHRQWQRLEITGRDVPVIST